MWVAAALGVALAVRWFVTLRYYRDLPLGLSDNFFYHRTANLIADGQGFVNPFVVDAGIDVASAAHPPLYSLYLAAWSLLGADTPLWHRLASGVVSAAAVVPVMLLVRSLASQRAAILAGFAVALYPPLWMNDGLILSESLYVTVAALTLWAAHRAATHPSTARVVVLGVVLAAGALTRSEAAMLLVLLLVPLLLTRRKLDLARRVRLLVVAAGVAAALMAPWVIRNLVTFDEPTLLSAGAGYVIELGNCDLTYSGKFLGYWHAGCDDGAWPDGDESVIGAHKLAEGRTYVLDHLDEVPKVAAARIGRLFGVFRPFEGVDFDALFERRVRSHALVGLWAHWAVTVAAAAGAVILWRRRVTLIPVAAMVAAAALAAALSFGITRYRVGADVALLVLAAVAAGALTDRLPPMSSRFFRRSIVHPDASDDRANENADDRTRHQEERSVISASPDRPRQG